MPKFKSFENFQVVSHLTKNDVKGIPFQHSVIRVRKKAPLSEVNSNRQKYQNVWYAKHCEVLGEAYAELLAQELLRLFYPNQPKTRIALSATGEVYILSKEIPGFHPINLDHRAFKKRIERGSIKGLGIIMVLALIIQEIDLKNGNVGLDNASNITKIDGDNCFINIFKHQENFFGSSDIEHLPFIKQYYSYNWFDIVKGGVKKTSRLFSTDFENIPVLRQEINETILSVLLISDEQFKHFANFYIDKNQYYCDLLSEELIKAKFTLLQAALKSPSFHNFFQKTSLPFFIASLAARIEDFTNMGKIKIFKNTNVTYSMVEQLLQLQSEMNNASENSISPSPVLTPFSSQLRNKKNVLPIREIYQNCHKMTKKEIAESLSLTENALGYRLKSQYHTTFRALKSMSNATFEKYLKENNLNSLPNKRPKQKLSTLNPAHLLAEIQTYTTQSDENYQKNIQPSNTNNAEKSTVNSTFESLLDIPKMFIQYFTNYTFFPPKAPSQASSTQKPSPLSYNPSERRQFAFLKDEKRKNIIEQEGYHKKFKP